jgi:hypothetical protein
MFIAAGVLLLLVELFHLIASSMTSSWLYFLAYVALTVAFVALFLWRTGILARIAFIVAAVGWALMALASLPIGLGAVDKVGIILALVGTLVSGILVFARNLFNRQSSTIFLVAAILGAIWLLSLLGGFLPAILVLIIFIAFAALLIVTGVLYARRR